MKILITAGPTREYLDEVRYLSNASTGRMGFALTDAAIAAGHEVVLVCGPVALTPPAGCTFVPVESTQEMLDACLHHFPGCDGVIGAAAVCDFRPRLPAAGKIGKTGETFTLELIETPDILGTLGAQRGARFSLGFALEAESGPARAVRKLREKNCDGIVLNGPAAIGADSSSVDLIDRTGEIVEKWAGRKQSIAVHLINWIDRNFSRR